MPRSARTNPLALAVLACLYERPMHPYEVAQTLRSRAKQESVRLNYGSLYAIFEALERRGHVRATGTVREGRRPERTVYEITDLGALELTDWLTEVVAAPAKEFPQFMAGLSFLGVLSPEDALDALRQRRVALELTLARLRSDGEMAAASGVPRLFLLEGEFEQRVLAAELEFVVSLVADLESGSLEGLDEWREFVAGAGIPPRPT